MIHRVSIGYTNKMCIRDSRYTRTNNFYKETYHIPFIIYNCDKQQKVIDTYIASKDIGATILDLCDVEKPESFTGTSIFSDRCV